MTPYLVGPHVRRIQVLLPGIEHHPVNGGLLVQLGVLDVLVESALSRHTEDVQEACMVVKGVAIDVIGFELRCQHKDGAGLGVCIVCSGWMSLVRTER